MLRTTIPDALEGFVPARPNPHAPVPSSLPPYFNGLFKDRTQAEAALNDSLKAKEFNYYVTWLDSGAQGRYGLMATFAVWVGEGLPYVNRLEAW